MGKQDKAVPVFFKSATIASRAVTLSTTNRETRSPNKSRTRICSTEAASSKRRGIGERPAAPDARTAEAAASWFCGRKRSVGSVL